MRKLLLFAFLTAAATMPLRAQRDSVYYYGDDSLHYYDQQVQAPRGNPIRYFGSPFCDHFLEASFAGNWCFGLRYAYLPEVWGFHLHGQIGRWRGVAAGTDYRLSRPWSEFDWHLYGSVGVGRDEELDEIRPTVEAGVRLAAPVGLKSLCLNSFTLGVMTDMAGVYVTVGMGVSFAALLSIPALFLL